MHQIASVLDSQSERVLNTLTKLEKKGIEIAHNWPQTGTSVMCCKYGLPLFQWNPQSFRLSLWTKHEYTTNLKPQNNPNRGLPAHSLHQERRKSSFSLKSYCKRIIFIDYLEIITVVHYAVHYASSLNNFKTEPQ